MTRWPCRQPRASYSVYEECGVAAGQSSLSLLLVHVVGLLRRAGGGEVGTAWLDRRLKLHQLGARAIRIVDIQLPLAIQSDLRRAMLRGQAVSGIEQVNRLLHVENPQREVVK